MLKAFQILNKIEQTNSINEKKELMSYDDELLKLILKAAYDPNIVFGVKKIPRVSYCRLKLGSFLRSAKL